MTTVDAGLTVSAFLVLIAIATYVLHRLNLQQADRIALRSYGRPPSGGRAGTPADGDSAQPSPPPLAPPAVHTHRDHRDGGRGRFRPRRRTRGSRG
ncbi:hypothetical protein [Streptomyces sp. R41]|uniref:Uncharacterized protein n=1 Tax=Streptomyces sp. R41 TaxID=3238632 RepID=A0AB39RJJ5_9ACTN